MMFHCIMQASRGGDSLFVDGFNVAEKLYQMDPKAFKLLTTSCIHHFVRDKLEYNPGRNISHAYKCPIKWVQWCVYDINPIYALRMKNASESDLRSKCNLCQLRNEARNSSLGREIQRIMGSGSYNKQATVRNLNKSMVSLALNFNLFYSALWIIRNKEP